MNLVDRYVYEAGRHLPRKSRGDIQVELRSSIYDALEARFGTEPSEDEVAEYLSSMGPPEQVAASYYPEGQYLIGPALFPLFKLVALIAVAGVLGAQVIAWAVAFFLSQAPFSPLETIGGMVNSIPATFGMVVIVFALLQWLEVRPDLEEDTWDPRSLPQIDEFQPVKRGEMIFGIVVSMVILALLVFFPQYIGFVSSPGGEFFANPVIEWYSVWIIASLAASIALDVYLLWQARWTLGTRIAKFALNLFSVAVLALLFQGHSAWLAARGAAGIFSSLEMLTGGSREAMYILGMQAYRMAFGVALIVILVETITMAVRQLIRNVRRGANPGTYKLGETR
jgi:hypothetical protein